MRNLGACILLSITILSSPASAEMWRCEGNLFTTRLNDSSGINYRRCERFDGSLVCGEGRNRFITPAKAGLRNNLHECVDEDPNSSPLVERATLDKVARGEKKPINFERKFARPEKASEKGDFPARGFEQIEEFLPLAQQLLESSLGNFPGN